MRKVFVMLLAVVLMLSMTGTVYGGTINGDDTSNPTKTATAKVTLTLTDSYVVTIPDAFDLDEVDADSDGCIDYYSTSGTVKGKIKHIAVDHWLNVTINGEEYTSESGWYLKKMVGDTPSNDADDKHQYYMRVGEHVDSNNPEIGQVVGDASILGIPFNVHDEQTITLHVKLLNYPTTAGKYEDQLTFKVTINPMNS